MKIHRFKIYDVRELYKEIIGKYQHIQDEFIKDIPGFLKGKGIMNRFVKDQIIGSIANVLFSK